MAVAGNSAQAGAGRSQERYTRIRQARPALALVLLLAGACGTDVPERADPTLSQSAASPDAARHLVAAAHPRAVEAGLEVLRAGGSAVDAAVAVQMVLGVIESPETGLGGGGFLLFYERATGHISFHDGRETAPGAATATRFAVRGRPIPHNAAVVSGRSVGVPGLVAMLDSAHRAHGSLPWERLLAPAIETAREGFEMPVRLQRQLRGDVTLRFFGDIRRHYLRPLRASPPMLTNPTLAATLTSLAEEGPAAFYDGAITEQVIARAAARVPWRGDLQPEDFTDYRAIVRDPVCGTYRSWRICGAPPPSAGGIAVLQILGMLEHFAMDQHAADMPLAMHLLAEAGRLAFADLGRYVGDPAFVRVPITELLDPGYLQARAALIDPDTAMTSVQAGDLRAGSPAALRLPVGSVRQAAATAAQPHAGGTSHFTIVDALGNVALVTTTIEAPFGSRMRAAGFLLNNQLTDFTFTDRVHGEAEPNLPAAGKRPRSSMSPVLVFDADNELVLAFGARGGSRIIGHVARVLVAVLDWQMPLAEAVAAGNFLHRGLGLEIERDSELIAHRDVLSAKGHSVIVRRMPSGLHGIQRSAQGWHGAADPRLDGIAAGDPHHDETGAMQR